MSEQIINSLEKRITKNEKDIRNFNKWKLKVGKEIKRINDSIGIRRTKSTRNCKIEHRECLLDLSD